MKVILLFLSVFLLFTAGCTVQKYEVINQELHIYLKNKGAEKVYLLTSLDQFEPHEVSTTDSGTWEAILPSDMEFKYFFMVDEEVFIPECEMRETDDFGSENCIYTPLLGMP